MTTNMMKRIVNLIEDHLNPTMSKLVAFLLLKNSSTLPSALRAPTSHANAAGRSKFLSPPSGKKNSQNSILDTIWKFLLVYVVGMAVGIVVFPVGTGLAMSHSLEIPTR